MKIAINPMHRWGNRPYIQIWGDVEDLRDKEYTRVGDLYYYQNPETGYTTFLYHSGKLIRKDATTFTTENHEGFGGASFTLKVKDIGTVILVGPWSGGSYCANEHLPKPCYEVTVTQRKFANLAYHYTVEQINKWLAEDHSLWCLEKKGKLSQWDYDLTYDGKLKSQLTDSELKALQEKYNKYC